MILSLVNTAIAIGCLLILGSMRTKSNFLALFALATGILTLHSAHDILFESEARTADHRALVDAAFTLLYIPFLYLSAQKLTGKVSNRTLIAASISSVGLFTWIYSKTTLDASMPLYSFANLFWTVANTITFCFWVQLGYNTFKLNKSNGRFMGLVHIAAMLMVIPYLTATVCAFLPQDNFLIPYRPMLSLTQMMQLLKMIAWVALLINLFILKAELDTLALRGISNPHPPDNQLRWG